MRSHALENATYDTCPFILTATKMKTTASAVYLLRDGHLSVIGGDDVLQVHATRMKHNCILSSQITTERMVEIGEIIK